MYIGMGRKSTSTTLSGLDDRTKGEVENKLVLTVVWHFISMSHCGPTGIDGT